MGKAEIFAQIATENKITLV